MWNAPQQDFEIADETAGVQGILASVTATVDETYLVAAGSKLKIVANYGAGVDNIDLAAASRRGVVVANTPGVVTAATAEFTIALILALLRRVAEGDRLLRRRQPWRFSIEFMLGESLAGKTLGIIGPGRIGREVARLAEVFGARILFAGRQEPLGPLLGKADIVSIHCPLTEDTRHLIDANALAQMKPTAVLVNTARGGIVNEAALVAALTNRDLLVSRSTSTNSSHASLKRFWKWRTSCLRHTSAAGPMRRANRWECLLSTPSGPCSSTIAYPKSGVASGRLRGSAVLARTRDDGGRRAGDGVRLARPKALPAGGRITRHPEPPWSRGVCRLRPRASCRDRP